MPPTLKTTRDFSSGDYNLKMPSECDITLDAKGDIVYGVLDTNGLDTMEWCVLVLEKMRVNNNAKAVTAQSGCNYILSHNNSMRTKILNGTYDPLKDAIVPDDRIVALPRDMDKPIKDGITLAWQTSIPFRTFQKGYIERKESVLDVVRRLKKKRMENNFDLDTQEQQMQDAEDRDSLFKISTRWTVDINADITLRI